MSVLMTPTLNSLFSVPAGVGAVLLVACASAGAPERPVLQVPWRPGITLGLGLAYWLLREGDHRVAAVSAGPEDR
jgi:hypothetical protein